MDFVFEPEEMLVSEVRFHLEDGRVCQKYKLSDYTEINGIKMPQTFRIGGFENKFEDLKDPMPIKFTFNVDYDPKIFDPPFWATTSDAYKPKPKN